MHSMGLCLSSTQHLFLCHLLPKSSAKYATLGFYYSSISFKAPIPILITVMLGTVNNRLQNVCINVIELYLSFI